MPARFAYCTVCLVVCSCVESYIDCNVIISMCLMRVFFLLSTRYRCEYCAFAVGSKPLMETHLRFKHTSKPVSYSDTEIVESSAQNTSNNTDDSELIEEIEQTPKLRREKQPRKVHKCLDCNYETLNARAYYKHCKTHVNNRPYLCQICNNRFRDMKAGKQHNRHVHSGAMQNLIFSPIDDTQTPSMPSTSECPPPALVSPPLRPVTDDTPTKRETSFLAPLVDEEFDELPDLESTDANVPPVVARVIKVEKKEELVTQESIKKCKPISLSESSDASEFVCCHCSHKGDQIGIGEHMRSQHKDMPFIVRKKHGETLTLEIYQYTCIYCNNGSDSLMEAMGHWVKNHVTLDFKFDTSLQSSQDISSDTSSQVQPNIKHEASEVHHPTSEVDTSILGLESVGTKEDEESDNSSQVSWKQPPRKRARMEPPLAESSPASNSQPNTSMSEDDFESEGDVTSDLDTTLETATEEKLYRCSSCRRSSKIKDEILAHQKEKVNIVHVTNLILKMYTSKYYSL